MDEFVCPAEIEESRSSWNLSFTSFELVIVGPKHLQLLHASCQIKEVSASSGGNLCLLEVLRACWLGVTWWQILLLLHAALFSCVHSRRKCNQHQLLLKTLPQQGESHSELQSRLCINQVLYQLELFFAEVCQNYRCPLKCAYSMRRWLQVSPLSSFFLFDR